MQVITTKQFKKTLEKLNPTTKNKVISKLEIFIVDWKHPSLKSHLLKGRHKDKWAFRVTYSVRVIFMFEGKDLILLLDVGEHDKVY